MRSFKRTLLKALVFVLSVALISAIIVEPYYQNEIYHYQDASVRDHYAGTLDVLVCGSSHAYRAIVPEVLDRRLDCSSYNLSVSLMTMKGRYELLKKELDRNPVKLVILDASYNSMTRNRDKEGPEGDIYQLGRYKNPLERLSYFFRTFPLDEYMEVYYDTLHRGYHAWRTLLRGEGAKGSSAKYETKGYLSLETTPFSQPAPQDYHSESINLQIDPECEAYMSKMIALCQERGIPVIVVVTPITQYSTLRFAGLDEMNQYLESYCSSYGVPYYDLNLFRGKTVLFPDSRAFYDATHMSDAGARPLTDLICDLIEALEKGESTDHLFYGSYAEAEEAALSGQDVPVG